MDRRLVATCCVVLWSACATPGTRRNTGSPHAPVAADANDRCVHGVACETCVKCHPELAARFRAAGDWCPEHGVPESQCGLCHPEVVVPPPQPPDGADVRRLVDGGQDLASLEPHVVRALPACRRARLHTLAEAQRRGLSQARHRLVGDAARQTLSLVGVEPAVRGGAGQRRPARGSDDRPRSGGPRSRDRRRRGAMRFAVLVAAIGILTLLPERGYA